MKKEITKEVTITDVVKIELYCDICKKKIEHNDMYWDIDTAGLPHEIATCSMHCAKAAWRDYSCYPKAYMEGDFYCRPKRWDEFTGHGKVYDRD